MSSYFQAGLLLEPDAFYVRRAVDDALFAQLSRMEPAVLLAPRQVGKSSLCDRVARRLVEAHHDEGMRVVYVEDATVGVASVVRDEQHRKWYYGLGKRIAEALGLVEAFRTRWNEDQERVPLERFRAFLLHDVCTEGTRTVVFLDEIDHVCSVAVDFDAFCEFLRSTVSERGQEPAWKRIVFCLAGVATPEELLRDTRRFALALGELLKYVDDFTREEAEALAPGLAALPGGASPWLDAVYAWTEGHPALMQALCKSLVDDLPATPTPDDVVAERASALFLRRGRIGHPIFADTDRRFGGAHQGVPDPKLPQTLELYRRVLAGEIVKVSEGDTKTGEDDVLQRALRVGGLVAFREGTVRCRNRLFATLFDATWVGERKGVRPFVETISRWHRTRDSALLLDGRLLAEAEAWADTRDDLTDGEKEYLKACRDREVAITVAREIETRERELVEERARRKQERAEREREHAERERERETALAKLEATRKRNWRRAAVAGIVATPILALACYVAVRARDEARLAERRAHENEVEARRQSLRFRAAEMRVRCTLPGFEAENLADVLVLYHHARASTGGARTGVEEALFHCTDVASSRMSLLGHRARVSHVTFSPDGRYLLSAGEDGTATLWTAHDGRHARTIKACRTLVNDVVFSPDGALVVTACEGTAGDGPAHDDVARVWRASDGVKVAELRGHEDGVTRVAYARDGRRLVTAANDNTARIWNTTDWTTAAVLRGHTGPLRSAVFSPDGARLVTGSVDHTARIWNVANGVTLRVLQGHDDIVADATFSPDGTRVVTASVDRTARLWDVANARLTRTLSGHEERLISASFSPDGELVLTASDDRTARVWGTRDGSPRATLRGHTDALASAIFSPGEGAQVLTSSWDGTARVWRASSGDLVVTLQGHIDGVRHATFAPDATVVATASDDTTVRLWNAHAPRLVTVLNRTEVGLVNVAMSHDGSRAAAALENGTVVIRSAASGQTLRVLSGHRSRVIRVSFSPDDARVLSASEDGTARVWDARTPPEGDPLAERVAPDSHLRFALEAHRTRVTAASFSDDGARILTASVDGTAKVWDARDGRLLVTVRHAETSNGAIQEAVFSPRGDRFVTAAADGTARIWSASDGRALSAPVEHDLRVNAASFARDGRRFVTSSLDGTAKVWSSDGLPLARLEGHTGAVIRAFFSADGAHIVTASQDTTARVWRSTDGALVASLRGHLGPVVDAAFSPDGTRVLTASRDHTARLWSAEDGRMLAVLSRHNAPVVRALFVREHLALTADEDGAIFLWNLAPTVARTVACELLCGWPIWSDPARAELHAACAGVRCPPTDAPP